MFERSWRGALDVFGFAEVIISGRRLGMARVFIERACMANT
jgi:hypothetical protein